MVRTLRRDCVVVVVHASDRPGTRGERRSIDAEQPLPFRQDPLHSRRRQNAAVNTHSPSEPSSVPVRALPLHATAGLFDLGNMRHVCSCIWLDERELLEARSVGCPTKGVENVFHPLVVDDVSGEVGLAMKPLVLSQSKLMRQQWPPG